MKFKFHIFSHSIYNSKVIMPISKEEFEALIKDNYTKIDPGEYSKLKDGFVTYIKKVGGDKVDYMKGGYIAFNISKDSDELRSRREQNYLKYYANKSSKAGKYKNETFKFKLSKEGKEEKKKKTVKEEPEEESEKGTITFEEYMRFRPYFKIRMMGFYNPYPLYYDTIKELWYKPIDSDSRPYDVNIKIRDDLKSTSESVKEISSEVRTLKRSTSLSSLIAESYSTDMEGIENFMKKANERHIRISDALKKHEKEIVSISKKNEQCVELIEELHKRLNKSEEVIKKQNKMIDHLMKKLEEIGKKK